MGQHSNIIDFLERELDESETTESDKALISLVICDILAFTRAFKLCKTVTKWDKLILGVAKQICHEIPDMQIPDMQLPDMKIPEDKQRHIRGLVLMLRYVPLRGLDM